jgi:hypothetical protein
MFVQRKGTTVARFPNVQHDGTWIRAVSRLGLAFLNEAGPFRPRLGSIDHPFLVSSAIGPITCCSVHCRGLNVHLDITDVVFGSVVVCLSRQLVDFDG